MVHPLGHRFPPEASYALNFKNAGHGSCCNQCTIASACVRPFAPFKIMPPFSTPLIRSRRLLTPNTFRPRSRSLLRRINTVTRTTCHPRRPRTDPCSMHAPARPHVHRNDGLSKESHISSPWKSATWHRKDFETSNSSAPREVWILLVQAHAQPTSFEEKRKVGQVMYMRTVGSPTPV